MKLRHFAPLLIVLFLVCGAPAARAATGFVNSPLLLSPEAPKDGDTVTLSVLFHNAEAATISGTVLFYDNDTLLDRKDLSIDPGDVGIASTTFKISSGIHKFSATMSNIDKPGDSGKLEVVVIPEATVTLPPQLITRNLALDAQAAGDASDSSESVILDKVDAAQTAVLGALPASVKTTVGGATSSIDSWRASTAADLSASQAQVQAAVDAGKKIDAANAARKPGSKAIVKPATADNGPFNTIKLMALGLFAMFFNIPFVFYLGSILLLYLIVRFIWRRIRKSRARGRKDPRPVK